MTRPVHLHRDDCPATLALLAALTGNRAGRAEELGIQTSEHGAFVDWDRLTSGARLSSTETAVAVIAQGIARLEAHGGGVPDRLARPLHTALHEVTRMTGPNPNLSKQPKLARLTNARRQALQAALGAHSVGSTYRVSNQTDTTWLLVYWQTHNWLLAEGLAIDVRTATGQLTPAGVELAEQVTTR